MILTFRDECWIKFHMKLIGMTLLDNYYSKFYHTSYKQIQLYSPSTAVEIPSYFTQNE